MKNPLSNSTIREIITWNKEKYPNPTFQSHTKTLKIDPILNHEKIKLWTECGILRTKKKSEIIKTLFRKDGTPRQIKESKYYAKEDLIMLIEKETLRKEVRIFMGKIKSKDRYACIIRDFRKKLPDVNEIELLSDSFGTFVCQLALQKIKESSHNLSPEIKAILSEFLHEIIPTSI